jgi:hypothetical protein
MIVDGDSGCTTCTGNPANSWNVFNIGFSMTNSVTSWNYITTNASWSYFDSDVTVNGTLGEVDCIWHISANDTKGVDSLIGQVPVLAVNNYNMTNSSRFLNEF